MIHWSTDLPINKSTLNYFEFYSLPVSFIIDESKLKKRFFANSKKYHPDFYTLESEEKQAEILELSTLNNQAYKTLSDPDKCMKYILDLKDVLGEEGKNQIPQDFLMEMMDFNENLMELEFGFDAAVYQKLESDLEQLENQLYSGIKEQLEKYDENTLDTGELLAIKDYYLKKRYLLRIRENLSKFAEQ